MKFTDSLVTLFREQHVVLLGLAAVCLGFVVMEIAKAFYFNGENTPFILMMLFGLYLYFPWFLLGLLSGVLAINTLSFSVTHRYFLVFHGIAAMLIAFFHIAILTSAYWVFWPERVVNVTVWFVLGEQTMKWFHFELLAYLAILFIWRRRFQLNLSTGKAFTNKINDQLALITESGHVRLNPDQIEWLLADDNYIIIHADDRQIRVRGTLKEMSKRLCKDQFKQTHRSAIVNLSKVREIGSNRLTLLSGIRVPVSRRRHRILLEAFNK